MNKKKHAHNLIKKLIISHSSLEVCKNEILNAYEMLYDVFVNAGKVLVCGNGGSAADCEHIVGELMKGFKLKRPLETDERALFAKQEHDDITDFLQGSLPAISLVSQTALISAISNDINFEYIFAQQVYGYGKKGDAVIALSTSGNAKNIINACITAKALGLIVIGFTGETGGLLKKYCDVCICVPFSDTAAVQEKHLPIYHAVCAALELTFWME